MKKIISFDWDGTLWYPKSTKHDKAPHWVYEEFSVVDEANAQLVLIPWVLEVLDFCKSQNIVLVLISTNPNITSIAQKQVEDRANLLWVDRYFDFIISARDYPESKWEILTEFAKHHKIDLDNMLHIWDSYNRDYASVQTHWISSILIKTNYMKEEYPFAIEHSNMLEAIRKFI